MNKSCKKKRVLRTNCITYTTVHVKMVRIVNPMWFLQIKLNEFNTSFKGYNLK